MQRREEALNGIRVVEFASYVAGPYAGSLLADFGAEVIKVEPPGAGDPFRGWGTADYSATFASVNRNKKSVALDLKTPEGQKQARALALSADVVIENHRVGAMDRLGLGYAELARENARLIYCSITGFGDTGPYADRPGYDTVGQAMGGLLSLLTDLNSPSLMGISLSDHIAGMTACNGILTALAARSRSGLGQRVDTSLLESTVAFVGENAARFFDDGKVPDRATRTRIAQVFAFLDKAQQPFVIHLSSPPKFWEGLCRVVGHEDFLEDLRFRDRSARTKNYEVLHQELARVFAGDSRENWLAKLHAADVPAGPLYTIDQVFSDPQVQHLALVQDVTHPIKGSVRLIRNGVRLSGTPAHLRSAAPALGQHNDDILGRE